ncbi:hypothetical protein [Paenibacillus sp. YYML68]|uniref:hypothetical protein n=1 Tax=Paenibacillus sp. YYML68 TaxID=2909250 RepID=UPI002492220A|nr:hypothetical protein [Paenibacillus sp. YYML68]
MQTREEDLLDGKRLVHWLRTEGAYASPEEIVRQIQQARFHPFGIHVRSDRNERSTLKKGDTVVMHTCMEASNPKYAGRLWTCKSDAFRPKGHNYCSIFLEGYSGCFSTEYLQLVQLPQAEGSAETDA